MTNVSRETKGLLFDADGTLIDTYDIILASMRYAINDVLGENLSDTQLMARVGTPLLDQMLHFTGGNEARAAEIVQIYRDHNDGVHDAYVKAFADTKEALERFRAAGLPMGVVTSKRHAMAVRGLEMSGIAEFFSFVIGHDDWPEHKPAPGPVVHGCELLGLAPDRCLYIGDSPYDIQAGNAAGCTTVAALWGMFSHEELAAQHPAIECESLSALADYLGV